jgi:hypothetical protein
MSIHDNFLYVQNLVKELHSARTPSLFLKLDISKAFDSVGWAYLIEVMTGIGFGQLWRDWVCLSLASATSRVRLNGEPGDPFSHARGLRRGDPLSPMLFILAIDPLQRLLELATQSGILAPIRSRATHCIISMYADDASIFVNPLKEELPVITAILDCFGKRVVSSPTCLRPRSSMCAVMILTFLTSYRPSLQKSPPSLGNIWAYLYTFIVCGRWICSLSLTRSPVNSQ